MRHHRTALQHHFLDIAETQAEAEVQPDAMGDDLDGDAISPVAWCSGGVHRCITSRTWANLTVPTSRPKVLAIQFFKRDYSVVHSYIVVAEYKPTIDIEIVRNCNPLA